jgi:8-oxo-dGTP pyrophosphatase MutT (NUDIX family)
MIKHATAGAFIFCHVRGEWRLGLVEHPRMGVLACPGGHVEEDETPAEAALREVEEETGLRGVRVLGYPAPALPAGFPATHALVPLPWWITEVEVPADNHLAEVHVHVDHMWVALAEDPSPEGVPAHPFGWYSLAETAALPMFEDSRMLAPLLFGCISDLASGKLSGAAVLSSLTSVC